jgi:magnesium-transporting ATPase (P-type)
MSLPKEQVVETDVRQQKKLWYSKELSEVFEQIASSEQGLNTADAQQRLLKFGPNRLPETKPRSAIKRLLSQFHNVLIYVLLAAALVTALLSHWIDTGVIIGVVVINAIIGFVQEGKAEDAIRAIKQMLSVQAMVLRDGKKIAVPADELVVGDLVYLQSGDKVPADLRLVSTKNLHVQEAALTGESLPVEKNPDIVELGADLGDRTSMAFSGTLVSSGQGTGLVVATASDTELGLITTLLTEVEQITTPLVRQMAQFGKLLTAMIIVIASLTVVFGVLVHDYSLSYMFLSAVGLAVAAIPEGLPAIMTITLAIGVQRMAKRHAIIRKLPAIETLGAVTVICSDKTGTLTCNEMTACNLAIASESQISVTGVGYDPHGDFLIADQAQTLSDDSDLLALARAAMLCNDATLVNKGGEWCLNGDPTDGALYALGLKAGLSSDFEGEAWPRTDVIPFESEHRFMATLHHDHTGKGVSYVKGAPERLFSMCSHQRDGSANSPINEEYWQEQMHKMASQGQRVIAIAAKDFDTDHCNLTFEDVEQGLVLLGIVGIIDPPREDAIAAVKRCKAAGIQVKMITGDHKITALAIGEQLGIGDGDQVLTGHDIELMSDQELGEVVDDIDVFARSSPEHKLRLVTALQANGHVIAMTGDGVNDAPALKRADVGTAMGQNGTEVAKEASEMVLADDNFSSIADAVEEGRTVYDNLRKAILFILPTNGGEALVIIAAIMMGYTLPITPVQILWVNMITAVTLALALAFEPPEQRVMQRPPHRPNEAILSPAFLWRIGFVSFILMLGTFGLFLWQQNQNVEIEYARTVAVNTLVMFEIFYLFNSRYITEGVLNKSGFFGNRYVLIAIAILLVFQMLFTYTAPMQSLFGTAAISFESWSLILIISSSVLFLVELEKVLVRKFTT